MDLYIENKLARQASFQLLKTVVSQIADKIPNVLTRGVLDADVHVGPIVDPNKVLSQCAMGLPCLRDFGTGEVTPIFPENFDLDAYVRVTNLIDRGSTGATGVFFMASLGYLWSVLWGTMHDINNAIKGAAKKMNYVRNWWLIVTKFSGVSNLNHGPFRSGAWGKAKQSCHRSWMETRKSSSEDRSNHHRDRKNCFGGETQTA